MKYYFYYYKLCDGSIKMSDCLYRSFGEAMIAAEQSTWHDSPECVEARVIKGLKVL